MGWLLDVMRTFRRWTQNKRALNDYETVEWDPAYFVLTEQPTDKRIFVTLTAAGGGSYTASAPLVIDGSNNFTISPATSSAPGSLSAAHQATLDTPTAG